jgi:hypothetical protein
MSTLTDDEKSILTNALPVGGIMLMNADETGDFVRAGTFDYSDKTDPSLQARGIESLQSLIRRGLVRHEHKKLYTLTGTGFERAREYAGQ